MIGRPEPVPARGRAMGATGAATLRYARRIADRPAMPIPITVHADLRPGQSGMPESHRREPRRRFRVALLRSVRATAPIPAARVVAQPAWRTAA